MKYQHNASDDSLITPPPPLNKTRELPVRQF